jgi:alpha-beta hydrolase superfamily lysophospholipase
MSGPLAGTYLNAGEGTPMVLIVPGSGPTDRNGNSPQGINTDAYKLLAEALCELQISSVRVDKRGMFGSAAAGDPNAVNVELYAEDYRDWVETLTAQTGQACIYLFGHSEGALMVSAAAIGRDDVCGLILAAGMGRPFGDVLRTQLEANPANRPILAQAFGAIDQLDAGQSVDVSTLHPALGGLFAPQV